MKKVISKSILWLTAIILLFSLTWLLTTGKLVDRRGETEVIGSKVVDALETFKGANGRYPSTLEELRPGFLATIPAPTWGEGKWHYRLLQDGEFQLSVYANEDRYPALYYISSNKRWSYDH